MWWFIWYLRYMQEMNHPPLSEGTMMMNDPALILQSINFFISSICCPMQINLNWSTGIPSLCSMFSFNMRTVYSSSQVQESSRLVMVLILRVGIRYSIYSIYVGQGTYSGTIRTNPTFKKMVSWCEHMSLVLPFYGWLSVLIDIFKKLIVMEELNELKNLVIQTLEANGQLSNIRAQIRSSVFKIVDEPNTDKKVSPFHWENVKCQKLMEKENGKELVSLIKEYFQFYNMDYTNCVFASEANMRDEVKREVLALKLGIDKPDPEKPLLLTVIERSK